MVIIPANYNKKSTREINLLPSRLFSKTFLNEYEFQKIKKKKITTENYR